jgi:hypothetical protein
MRPDRMRNGFCWSADRLGAWTVVGCAGGLSLGALGASSAVVSTAGSRAPKGVSLGMLRCNGLRAPHPTRLETRTMESDVHANRRVLKPGMRKEADEREALTSLRREAAGVDRFDDLAARSSTFECVTRFCFNSQIQR